MRKITYVKKSIKSVAFDNKTIAFDTNLPNAVVFVRREKSTLLLDFLWYNKSEKAKEGDKMKKELQGVIHWGILGTGNISTTFVQALKAIPMARVHGVAARDEQAAKEFARVHNVTNFYKNYEELLKDDTIDVVYIGTIHTTHFDLMKQCILHNKSVLCEKPFTVNAKQAKEIIALAKEHNVFAMEAMWTKFLPVTSKVKEWISSGRIGKVKHIRADFGFCMEFDANHRIFDKNKAGGALLDVGIYPLTYTCHLLGQWPKAIQSSAILCETGVDEISQYTVAYEPNIMANLSSATTAEIGTDACIIGSHGSIYVPTFYGASEAFLKDRSGAIVEHYHVPHRVNGYEYEAEAVMNSLQHREKENTIHSLNDTLGMMEWMDRIRKDLTIAYPEDERAVVEVNELEG